MSDLLVKLYELEEVDFGDLEKKGIVLKRAIAPEKKVITQWVEKNFSLSWSSECDVALSKVPSTCFIAIKKNKILGFSCYDATAKGFFGPIGVLRKYRKYGIGRALLLKTLDQMRKDGYAYAIIGWAGPIDFFKKTVNAILIPDSEPGIYANMVKPEVKKSKD